MPLLYRPDGTVVDSDTGQLLGQQGAVTPTLNVPNQERTQDLVVSFEPLGGSGNSSGGGSSSDGTVTIGGVTYNRFGQRLDSLGNVAFSSFGGGGGGGGGGGSQPPFTPGSQPITSDSFLRPDGSFDWVGYANAQTSEPRFFTPTADGQITLPFLQDTQFALPASAAPLFDLNTAQFLQNAYQYNNDFNETVRRFNLEFPESQRQANLAAFGRTFAPGGQYLSVR